MVFLARDAFMFYCPILKTAKGAETGGGTGRDQ